MKKIIYQLHTEVQDALNEPEPHDYYERLVRMEALVKKLRATSEDTMILSRTAYNKGFSDAMSGDNFNPPYKIKDDRHADYSFGFQMGCKEYES
tara:strand:+ start:283 stop:564 length:282 start_codon:yes stop_codon:yes gene_type:complete